MRNITDTAVMIVYMMFVFWLMFFIGAVGIGGIDGASDVQQLCQKPATRWAIVNPGLQLGCWLSKPLHGEETQ